MIPPTNWLASLSSSAFCLLPPGVAVDRLLPAGNHLVLETHATSPSAPCPLCDQPSPRRPRPPVPPPPAPPAQHLPSPAGGSAVAGPHRRTAPADPPVPLHKHHVSA